MTEPDAHFVILPPIPRPTVWSHWPNHVTDTQVYYSAQHKNSSKKILSLSTVFTLANWMMNHQHLHPQNVLQEGQDIMCWFVVLWATRCISRLPIIQANLKQTGNFKGVEIWTLFSWTPCSHGWITLCLKMYKSHVGVVTETSPMPAATMAARQYLTLLFLFLSLLILILLLLHVQKLFFEIIAVLPLLLLVFYFYKIGTQYFWDL